MEYKVCHTKQNNMKWTTYVVVESSDDLARRWASIKCLFGVLKRYELLFDAGVHASGNTFMLWFLNLNENAAGTLDKVLIDWLAALLLWFWSLKFVLDCITVNFGPMIIMTGSVDEINRPLQRSNIFVEGSLDANKLKKYMEPPTTDTL